MRKYDSRRLLALSDGRWRLTSPAAVSGHDAGADGQPMLLPAAASGGPLPFDWWPAHTCRKGDGGPLGPLGPHVVERRGVQIN